MAKACFVMYKIPETEQPLSEQLHTSVVANTTLVYYEAAA